MGDMSADAKRAVTGPRPRWRPGWRFRDGFTPRAMSAAQGARRPARTSGGRRLPRHGPACGWEIQGRYQGHRPSRAQGPGAPRADAPSAVGRSAGGIALGVASSVVNLRRDALRGRALEEGRVQVALNGGGRLACPFVVTAIGNRLSETFAVFDRAELGLCLPAMPAWRPPRRPRSGSSPSARGSAKRSTVTSTP
jgi:hypothetical protein